MSIDDAPPLMVIGMEGVWSTAIMLLVFPIVAALPGRDLGSIETLWTRSLWFRRAEPGRAGTGRYCVECCLIFYFI